VYVNALQSSGPALLGGKREALVTNQIRYRSNRSVPVSGQRLVYPGLVDVHPVNAMSAIYNAAFNLFYKEKHMLSDCKKTQDVIDRKVRDIERNQRLREADERRLLKQIEQAKHDKNAATPIGQQKMRSLLQKLVTLRKMIMNDIQQANNLSSQAVSIQQAVGITQSYATAKAVSRMNTRIQAKLPTSKIDKMVQRIQDSNETAKENGEIMDEMYIAMADPLDQDQIQADMAQQADELGVDIGLSIGDVPTRSLETSQQVSSQSVTGDSAMMARLTAL
jgi:hypothetical protein